MENPFDFKPMEPLDMKKNNDSNTSTTDRPEKLEETLKQHKGLTEGRLIAIFAGILILTVVISVFIYAQSGERLKGQTPDLTHLTAPATSDESQVSTDIARETTTADSDLLQSIIDTETPTDQVVAGVEEKLDTNIAASDIANELIVPEEEAPTDSALGEAITLPEGIQDVIKSDAEVLYRDDSAYIPLAPETDAVSPAASESLDLQKDLLEAFADSCTQYKAELDYAYYHGDWTDTEKSYAVSLTQMKNTPNCLSECDYAFYDGIFQLHSENYMLDYSFDPLNPTPAPQSAKVDVLNIISKCTDNCDKLYDLYAFFVDYAKSQTVYSQNDKDMMHYLIDSNINTCEMCMELENPVFNESKYFTKEFESILDSLRTNYGDLYLKTTINPQDIPRETPNLFESGLTFNLIPTAYAANELTVTNDAFMEFVTAATAVENDIKSYLEDNCPEPVAPAIPAACTEVHFVDPGNPSTRINSFDAIYNELINDEPLLVQSTGVSGNVRYEFSTDTPIDPNLQFTDTVTTGNPLITTSPRVNLSSTDIVANFDVISVKVIDENNNTVGTCTDQISLMLADSAGIAEAPVEEFGESYAPIVEESGTTSSATSTSGGGSSSGSSSPTIPSGSTSGSGSSSSSSTTGGSSSGGVAGGTLPRCNSLEITRPTDANADGVPTVVISENGYRNEILSIDLSTASGVVSKLRFKSLKGNITFNNQGSSVDLPPSTTTVRMDGGPAAGEEDTVTVWALDNSNQGIQSCHDAFVVSVPVSQVAGAPTETEPTGAGAVIPESHPAAEPVQADEEEPAPMPVVHEGAETIAATEETNEDLPPTTPDDGPGVLVYFLGAGLGGLIFGRKKKNK